MKKIISAVLCACTLLTLASCAGEDANVEITTAGDLTTTESQTTAEIDLGLTPVGENASPIILPGVQTEHEGFYKVKSPLTWLYYTPSPEIRNICFAEQVVFFQKVSQYESLTKRRAIFPTSHESSLSRMQYSRLMRGVRPSTFLLSHPGRSTQKQKRFRSHPC